MKKIIFVILGICMLTGFITAVSPVYAQTKILLPSGQFLSNPNGNPCEKFTDPVTGQIVDLSDEECYAFLEPLPGTDEAGNAISVDALKIDTTKTIGQSFNNMYMFAIGIGSVLAVIMIALYGWKYMSNDKSVSTNELLKEKIMNVIFGMVLLVSIYVILNTINPQLLDIQPDLPKANLVVNRIDDPNFVKYISDDVELDTTGIVITEESYKDPTFLAYLAHQQGPGGAPAILWAAKKGYSSVPLDNPYVADRTDINKNMRGNAPLADVKKITGQSIITPSVFIKYWATKVEAAKRSKGVIPAPVQTGLGYASRESGLSIEMLTAICRIESYGCTRPDIKNGFGYKGLFQLSDDVFRVYGKIFVNPNIYDALQNSYAGAMYAKQNLAKLQRQIANF